MRPTPWIDVEKYRVNHPWAYAPYGSDFGAFVFNGPCGEIISCIVSAGTDEYPWSTSASAQKIVFQTGRKWSSLSVSFLQSMNGQCNYTRLHIFTSTIMILFCIFGDQRIATFLLHHGSLYNDHCHIIQR